MDLDKVLLNMVINWLGLVKAGTLQGIIRKYYFNQLYNYYFIHISTVMMPGGKIKRFSIISNTTHFISCWSQLSPWGSKMILDPFNPFRTKIPKYLFSRGNKPLLYHQIGNRNFLIFITNQQNLKFCVDKINYEHLAILSNLKSCQFAPRIVIFNLCICCQFEDQQIISPKIIPMSHRNI